VKDLALLTGTANPGLARRVAACLDVPLLEAVVGRYPDGEIEVQLLDSVRGRDCFVLQPTCPPVHDHLLELMVLTDALRRASAARVTAVVPYFGYARQDRKTGPREPVTAKLVANLLVRAGVQHLLALDLHAGQISGFFDIPLDHLSARMLLADYFLQKGLSNVVVVSPDVGGVRRARAFAQALGAPLAIIDKRRDRPNQVAEVVHVIGKVYPGAARGPGGVRLLHPPRAVGCGGGAPGQLAHPRAGGDGHHPPAPAQAARPHPGGLRGPAAGGRRRTGARPQLGE
jgi:ribose-phosphate pyrophosphokinase